MPGRNAVAAFAGLKLCLCCNKTWSMKEIFHVAKIQGECMPSKSNGTTSIKIYVRWKVDVPDLQKNLFVFC